MSCFDEGVLYLPEKYKLDITKPRLFQLHYHSSEKALRVHPVECSPKSLQSGDVFVLDDANGSLFRWVGSGANRVEIAKSVQFANNIKNNEYKGKANLYE